MRTALAVSGWSAVVVLTVTSRAGADDEPQERPSVTPSAYVERYYARNFNAPANGITNYRAFDNRHATFTLENAVIAVDGRADRFFGRVALQSGSTGETYYLAEPPRPGADGAASGGHGRPVPNVCLRLEYRHDASRDAIFFRGEVSGAGTEADPYIANARSQDTLTLGMTPWF